MPNSSGTAFKIDLVNGGVFILLINKPPFLRKILSINVLLTITLRMLERAGNTNLVKRDLVKYSFKNYFITQLVNINLPHAIVAEMCGTSITQIEKTNYHTTEAKMIGNALAY